LSWRVEVEPESGSGAREMRLNWREEVEMDIGDRAGIGRYY